MKRLTILAVVGLGTLLLLVGCGGSGTTGNVAACKAAMTVQLANAIGNPSAPAGTKPAACNGLSDAQLQTLASQVLGGS